MSTAISWPEITLRIVCALIAGILIGLNRGEHGHAAGLRTTILVCLAAALAMIQVNLLLGMAGRSGSSYVMLDLMRLPLGILSGMGFIGAGAIVRRGHLIEGVTTAATLWFVTVLGLCFGGGQVLLGAIALVLGMVVLSCFKWIELRIRQDRQAMLTVEIGPDGPTEETVNKAFQQAGLTIRSNRITYTDRGRCRKIACTVRWRGKSVDTVPPDFLQSLARTNGVILLEWVS
jgi:putative Mg2+ transporter-C (MgtC) family protein